jgi:hypothetical protein
VNLTAYVLHHSESIDPTLLDWIRHEIDSVLGLGPVTIVAVLGALIVAFPVTLMLAARRRLPTAPRRTPRNRLSRFVDEGGES